MSSFTRPKRISRLLAPLLSLITLVDAALDAVKASLSALVVNATASLALTSVHFTGSGTTIVMTSGSANGLTLGKGVAKPGERVRIVQGGAGATSITPASGVTVNGTTSAVSPSARYKDVTLLCTATDTYIALIA